MLSDTNNAPNPWHPSPKAKTVKDLGISKSETTVSSNALTITTTGYARAAAPKTSEQGAPPAAEPVGTQPPVNDETTEPSQTHPPVMAQMRPQPETRRKWQEKALAARNHPQTTHTDQPPARHVEQADQPGEDVSPPPGMSNHSSKRKQTTGDVGMSDSRRGTTSVR